MNLGVTKPQAVFINKDYTPFSIKRDQKIETLCTQQSIEFHSYDDVCLTTPGSVLNTQENPYKVYTAFMRAARKQQPVDKPHINRYLNFYSKPIKETISIKQAYKTYVSIPNKDLAVTGSQASVKKVLSNLQQFKNYKTKRDIPSIQGTTKLSAALKFGLLSPREMYHNICDKLSRNHLLINQLYWRDFYTHIAYHYPHVFGHSFVEKFDTIEWKSNTKYFNAWKQGKTGFPIVDAGMRQLNKTGFMHNRVRMITASFLIKDLHIDWRKGERYFAQKLVDYDPAVNNGNWQWVAGTGCDAAPYFRIFNPWLQQKKFDPDCTYIKRWVSELQNIDPKNIHAYHNGKHSIAHYPKPIIDHKQATQVTKKLYKV